MRTLELSLPSTVLCAMREFAAVQGVRYYLKGVLLEHGAGDTVLVATNGYVLGAYQVASSSAAVAPVRIIVPNELLKGIKPRGEGTIALRAEERDPAEEGALPRWLLTLEVAGMRVSAMAIDGRYPDWRQIVPRSLPGEVAQFNPSLLVRFQRAAAALKGKAYRGDEGISLGFDGERAVVTLPGEDHFYGQVAAWRYAPTEGIPTWALPS